MAFQPKTIALPVAVPPVPPRHPSVPPPPAVIAAHAAKAASETAKRPRTTPFSVPDMSHCQGGLVKEFVDAIVIVVTDEAAAIAIDKGDAYTVDSLAVMQGVFLYGFTNVNIIVARRAQQYAAYVARRVSRVVAIVYCMARVARSASRLSRIT